MTRKMIASLLLALLLLTALPIPTAYAADTVHVTLPGFSVTLNGQTTSNDYGKYPLLVYKDITYFPMTYYDCRLLGLTTSWSTTEGLGIDRNNGGFSEFVSEYVREVQSTRNGKNLRAQIAAGKIRVNGKAIDNSREPYPLLLFRDVTYFPMTWRFAVEEFGWDYHFDSKTGLTILPLQAPFATDEKLTILEEYATYEGNEEIWDWAGRFTGLGGLGLVSRWVHLQLPCCFGTGVTDSGRNVSTITLYNFIGEDITLLPQEPGDWEYRIYRVIGGRDELVYRLAIPFYDGAFPDYHNLHWWIHDNYWDREDLAKGTYRVELVHPEEFAYWYPSGMQEEVPVQEYTDGVADLTFSHTVTVK